MFRNLAKALVVTAIITGVQNLLPVEPLFAFGWPSLNESSEKPASTTKLPAFDKSAMIGNWAGKLKTDSGDPLPVRLLVRPVGDDSLALTMIYGGERSCMCNGKLEAENKRVCRFSLKSDGGAFCDKLGQLSLTLKLPSQIAYTLFGTNGQMVESGVLQKLAD